MKPLIFALLFSTTAVFAGTPISFENLRAGESIDVTFTSNGCFHRVTYTFAFQKADALTASVTLTDNGQRMPEAGKAPVALGSVTLSADEAAGLDRLFAFYRSNPPGGCTTVDSISAVQKKGDVVQTSESFVDGTCSTDDKKDLTLLSSIVAKVSEKAKKK